jgi:hypothetical protein
MADEASLNPQPLPPRVRIFVDREVAYDLAKMNRITASVLAKLGCGGCHSGRILHFQTIEDFVVNPKTLEVNELPGLGM